MSATLRWNGDVPHVAEIVRRIDRDARVMTVPHVANVPLQRVGLPDEIARNAVPRA
ncbi:hypothetical protein [Burkholderia seminalis]|uniref:hypothetical protein n=1 Tax=Burkholderia seminalis TaxID=488731 RepID=UPI003B97D379